MMATTPTSTRLLTELVRAVGDIREQTGRTEAKVDSLAVRLEEHIRGSATEPPPPQKLPSGMIPWVLGAIGTLAVAVGAYVAALQ